MKIKILIIIVLLANYSCRDEVPRPIPEKHSELSQGEYENYSNLLSEAYNSNNNFAAAFQLSNLRGDKSSTYELLEIAVEDEPSKCQKIYEWYYLYDRHNFGVNILKYDTMEFKKIVIKCSEMKDFETYEEYAITKDEEERLAEENQPIEDSTSFNMKLVNQLNQIHNSDQEIRARIAAKNISTEKENELLKEMQKIDSTNLIKIDKIFAQYGYPSRDMVGKEGNFTPALVIHHSIDLETRYKYLPILEKAVSDGLLYDGTLTMIKKRISDMELEEK